ncbi:cation diffusion facilitator family transporter [Gordonia sp. PS3]|uniref:Putative cation efflux protein n=1 Tax=Gordonia sihwensis NBRC 108236 TaxID=1223544 RepID=L7LJE4_9ACTN|nr:MULTISPECIES: cation diffusion facilitator family transporter [Gordonia]AUH68220.1 cation transporter [Gordonia sp. YC-JH1]KJR09575.1 cation diffusion facilitator family transporter [Gordonia sihwensis]KXT58709.1 cation diffusion facilitator family transporter [Gordonia sp. QH-12]MBY4570169.1 cation transporter [Gordonia sihwensis]GAC60222.1 putative cation efflux protein [Gordonia sihwensis NBRC 108236]
MSAEGSTRAIVAALAANAGIAAAKFVGFAITGSSSMLAEGVHSVADTSNQGLLLLGQKSAARKADELHPFGYGRSRYFYSFIVALVIFTLGSMFALYEGVEKIRHAGDHGLDSPLVAVVILLVAICLEGYSFHTARKESRPLKGGASWWQFIRTSRNPELPVVLLEDSGALIGLVLALAGVGLTMITGDAIWDGIGTLSIGVLLGLIAIVLIVEMKSLLIGEGATEAESETLRSVIPGQDVDRVIHMKTQYLGPEELLVAAKIAIAPGLGAVEIARAIDGAEARVRAAVPQARVIYLEPDIDRGENAS